MASRVLLLTGMTPNARIYDRVLPMIPNAQVVSWIKPEPQESIAGYAKRLAASVGPVQNVVVCGVSFGGIVARELALCLDARACVLISAVRNELQMPPHFRMMRPFAVGGFESFLALVGGYAAWHPKRIRTRSTARLSKLAGRSGAWHRWAATSVLRWKAAPELDRIPTVQIHGDRDATFPVCYVDPEIVVPGGGHVLPISHPREIAEAVISVAN